MNVFCKSPQNCQDPIGVFFWGAVVDYCFSTVRMRSQEGSSMVALLDQEMDAQRSMHDGSVF